MTLGSGIRVDIAEIKSQVANGELKVTESENEHKKYLLDLLQLMEYHYSAKVPAVLVEDVDKSVLPLQLNPNGQIGFHSDALITTTYPMVRLAQQEVDAAARSLELAKAARYPTLSLGGGLSTNYSSQLNTNIYTGQPLTFWDQFGQNRAFNINATISIPIFRNMRVRIDIKKAKINYENMRNEVSIAQNEFRKILDQAVLDVRTASERRMAAQASFEAGRESFRATHASYALGRSTIFDVTNVQTKMNQTEFDLIRAEIDLVFKTKIVDFYLGNLAIE